MHHAEENHKLWKDKVAENKPLCNMGGHQRCRFLPQKPNLQTMETPLQTEPCACCFLSAGLCHRTAPLRGTGGRCTDRQRLAALHCSLKTAASPPCTSENAQNLNASSTCSEPPSLHTAQKSASLRQTFLISWYENSVWMSLLLLQCIVTRAETTI